MQTLTNVAPDLTPELCDGALCRCIDVGKTDHELKPCLTKDLFVSSLAHCWVTPSQWRTGQSWCVGSQEWPWLAWLCPVSTRRREWDVLTHIPATSMLVLTQVEGAIKHSLSISHTWFVLLRCPLVNVPHPTGKPNQTLREYYHREWSKHPGMIGNHHKVSNTPFDSNLFYVFLWKQHTCLVNGENMVQGGDKMSTFGSMARMRWKSSVRIRGFNASQPL